MKFKDVIECYISGDWGSETPNSNENVAVSCIRGADIMPIRNCDYSEIPTRYISASSLASKGLKEGDIVIEKSGGSPTQSTGRVVLISKELLEEKENIVCSNFCTAIRIKEEWDPFYLYNYLLFVYNLGVFFNFEGKTSGLKNLDTERAYASIQIIKIDIAEQKKIAAVLRSIDDKIAINTRICRRLEQTARDLYDYYFNNVQISHEGCETSTVKDQFDVLFGYPFSTELFTEEETDKPVIRIRDILTRTISAYSIEDVDIRYLLHEQDLLIGMDGNFHMNLWDGKWAFLNQRCCRIRQCGDLNTKYLYYQIYPYIKAKEAQAKGSTVGHLSNDEIRDLPVIVPPSNIAIEFNSKIEPIVKQQIMTSRASEDLTRLRDWLLPIMMSGQTNIE